MENLIKKYEKINKKYRSQLVALHNELDKKFYISNLVHVYRKKENSKEKGLHHIQLMNSFEFYHVEGEQLKTLVIETVHNLSNFEFKNGFIHALNVEEDEVQCYHKETDMDSSSIMDLLEVRLSVNKSGTLVDYTGFKIGFKSIQEILSEFINYQDDGNYSAVGKMDGNIQEKTNEIIPIKISSQDKQKILDMLKSQLQLQDEKGLNLIKAIDAKILNTHLNQSLPMKENMGKNQKIKI